MQNSEVYPQLLKYAKQDMNCAKRNGQMAICGTKKGNVEILYNFDTKLFKAVNFNNSNISHTGDIPAKEMAAFIAGIYITE